MKSFPKRRESRREKRKVKGKADPRKGRPKEKVRQKAAKVKGGKGKCGGQSSLFLFRITTSFCRTPDIRLCKGKKSPGKLANVPNPSAGKTTKTGSAAVGGGSVPATTENIVNVKDICPSCGDCSFGQENRRQNTSYCTCKGTRQQRLRRWKCRVNCQVEDFSSEQSDNEQRGCMGSVWAQ